MSFSYLTFHVPFTAKPSVPYHIESCGTILSASEQFHPAKELNHYKILAVTLYTDKKPLNINKALAFLKEFIIFLNLRWSSYATINYFLNTPYLNFENEIKEAETIDEILNSFTTVSLGQGDYFFNFNSYGKASDEFKVLPLNVKEDFPKYISLVSSEEENHKRLREQILVFVIGESSDRYLAPLYENVNLKYFFLNSVFEDMFLQESKLDIKETECAECGRPFGSKKNYKKKLKKFMLDLTADETKKSIYNKLFEAIYKDRNSFVHELKRVTTMQQIQNLHANNPKFGYSLTDHLEGGEGSLGAIGMFTDLIRKHLVEQLKQIQPLSK